MPDTPSIKKYAIVKDGVVLSTVHTEIGFIEEITLNTLVDITDDVNVDQITEGYTYENGTFSAPLA